MIARINKLIIAESCKTPGYPQSFQEPGLSRALGFRAKWVEAPFSATQLRWPLSLTMPPSCRWKLQWKSSGEFRRCIPPSSPCWGPPRNTMTYIMWPIISYNYPWCFRTGRSFCKSNHLEAIGEKHLKNLKNINHSYPLTKTLVGLCCLLRRIVANAWLGSIWTWDQWPRHPQEAHHKHRLWQTHHIMSYHAISCHIQSRTITSGTGLGTAPPRSRAALSALGCWHKLFEPCHEQGQWAIQNVRKGCRAHWTCCFMITTWSILISLDLASESSWADKMWPRLAKAQHIARRWARHEW